MAREMVHQGRMEEAEGLLERLSKERPRDSVVWLELGRTRLSRGNAAGAAQSLEHARQLSPDPAVLPPLGQAYLLLERREEARAALEQAVVRLPGDVGSRYNLGRLLRLEGDLEAATRHLEKALTLSPDARMKQRLQSNLGLIYIDARRHSRALPLFEELIRTQPEKPEWRVNLAWALEGMGETRRALEQAREAARLKPDLAGAHHLIGTLLRTLGDPQGAIAACERALESAPDEPRSLALLASLRLELGQSQKARETASHLIEKDPAHPQGHYLLGQALMNLGETEAAGKEFETHRQLASRRRAFQHTAASLGED